MHFFYLDETVDTGFDLSNLDQPIMILGGVSLSDEKWNKTHQHFTKIISNYFNSNTTLNFELHSKELLSPKGDGPFSGHSMDTRCVLAKEILNEQFARPNL